MNEKKVVILKYKFGYRLLLLICALFAIGFTLEFRDYMRNVFFLVLLFDIIEISAFIYTQTSRIIIDENVDYITKCVLILKKKVYYKDMDYMKMTEDESTAYLVVYSSNNQKLLKVNMGGYTNTDYFLQKVVSLGLKLKD